MSGLSPQGLTYATGWWQTAAVVLPLFRCPAHRVMKLDAQDRVISQDQSRFMVNEARPRFIAA